MTINSIFKSFRSPVPAFKDSTVPRSPFSPVPAFCFLLLVVLGAILYAQTLHIPWIFDDIQNILDNQLIRDLRLAASRIGASRGVAIFSFALNYRFGGLDPVGFHVVNIALHIGSAWFVFLIMGRIFRENRWLPLAGALIFLTHPLQTQAVNYIVQRMAGMCAFFMLAAVYFYMRSRDGGPGKAEKPGPVTGDQERLEGGEQEAVNGGQGFGIRDSGLGNAGPSPVPGPRSPVPAFTGEQDSSDNRSPQLPVTDFTVSTDSRLHRSLVPAFTGPRLLFYFLSLGCCALALWTKQNAVVLPLLLLLVDRFFIDCSRGMWRRRLLYVAPFLLLTLFSAWQEMRGHNVVLKEAGRAQYWAKANETSANVKVAEKKGISLVKPPENVQAIYLVTEFSVLWLYIRLLFLPVGQVFDYGYPLTSAIVTLPNALALLGHLLLMGLAVRLRNNRPLISVGIAWFYLSLAVESTIIPLDAAVEHRVYMATFGFVLILLDILRSIPLKIGRFAATAAVISLLTVLTWQRNALWADSVAFARDNVEKAPFNQRNYLTLATAYADSGQWSEAEKTLRAAIMLRPDYPVPYENLGTTLVLQGRLREALIFYQIALNLAPDNATTLYNAGSVQVRLGNMAEARRVVERLKQLNSPLAGGLEALVAGAGIL